METADGGTARPDTPATATEFDYDKMGRVAAHRQQIGTQTYALGYSYNLAGQLTSETYPSGKVVSIGYDAGGRLSGITSGARTFASNLQYQGKGNALSSMTLGNSTTQSFVMNDRLQMTNQTLAKNSEILQKYDYGYGQIDSSGNLDTSKNNGQLGRIESYIGTAKQWTQKFSYDSIGRLSQAAEYRGDTSALSYKQVFDYDRFGNLYRKNSSNPTAGQATPLLYTPIEDADISKTTNRFTTNTSYDDAGNVVSDTKYRNASFWYDANGRMYKTLAANNINQSSAVYDASGQRVAQQVDNQWQFFIYDAFGKKVAEYGGQQAQDEGGVRYVMQDWQGSTRAIVGQGGAIQARMDYTAFGEEIYSGTGQRTTAQGFNATNNLNNKYALTERDKATGLDHTWWRKLENEGGRWTSPDQFNGSMNTGNPQSFNRYSYVENQPTNFVDPSGLLMIPPNIGTFTVTVRADDTPFDWDFWHNYYFGWANDGIGTNITPHDPIDIGLPDYAQSVYQGNLGEKLTDCINKVFAKEITGKNGKKATGANLLEGQKIANAPTVNDTEFSTFELQGGTNSTIDAFGASFYGDERRGPNGTVWIANDLKESISKRNYNISLLELQQRTYVHELGNLLSRKISSDGSATTFGDSNNSSDKDTGFQLEDCVFGNVKP